MSNTFVLYSEEGLRLTSSSSLEGVRLLGRESKRPAYIVELDSSTKFVRAHSFWPEPQERKLDGCWPADITQTAAFSLAEQRIIEYIGKSVDLEGIVRGHVSQPHETLLSDTVDDIARNCYSAADWRGALPAAGPQYAEAERYIRDELRGAAQRELRNALVRLSTYVADTISALDSLD